MRGLAALCTTCTDPCPSSCVLHTTKRRWGGQQRMVLPARCQLKGREFWGSGNGWREVQAAPCRAGVRLSPGVASPPPASAVPSCPHTPCCCLGTHVQVGFLACLRDFADWLVARGASDGAGNRFALPCPIEGDKVRCEGGRERQRAWSFASCPPPIPGHAFLTGYCSLHPASQAPLALPPCTAPCPATVRPSAVEPTRTGRACICTYSAPFANLGPHARRSRPLPFPTPPQVFPSDAQVNGLTIRLQFNKDKNWTRALKHMLVDLKFVLKFALVSTVRVSLSRSVSVVPCGTTRRHYPARKRLHNITQHTHRLLTRMLSEAAPTAP